MAAYTFAAQTVQAWTPVPTSTPPPAAFLPATSTPDASTQAWLEPPTFTHVPATPVCQDRAQFIGTGGLDRKVYKPNEGFNKIWTLKNVGDCIWDQYYDLVFAGQGSQLGAPSSIAFIPAGRTIQPGDTVDIYMSFTAPSQLGTYQSLWQLVDGYGSMLPIQSGFTDSALYTEIEVSNQSGGGDGSGRVTSIQFSNLQLIEGSQCGTDATYTLNFGVLTDGSVTASIHFTTQIAGLSENGLLSTVDEVISFNQAGVQMFDLMIWGPYADPAHVTVSAMLDGQVYGSYTIPCP